MRCISCGAELKFMQSGLDNITMVPSDKYCVFLCENCDRPPVNPDGALPPTEPEPARSGLAASLRPDERASDSTTRPALVPSEDDLDECEILLRRAIEMVRGSTRWSQPTRSLTDRMPGKVPLEPRRTDSSRSWRRHLRRNGREIGFMRPAAPRPRAPARDV